MVWGVITNLNLWFKQTLRSHLFSINYPRLWSLSYCPQEDKLIEASCYQCTRPMFYGIYIFVPHVKVYAVLCINFFYNYFEFSSSCPFFLARICILYSFLPIWSLTLIVINIHRPNMFTAREKPTSALKNSSFSMPFPRPQIFSYVLYVFLSIWSLNSLCNKIQWTTHVLKAEQRFAFQTIFQFEKT